MNGGRLSAYGELVSTMMFGSSRIEARETGTNSNGLDYMFNQLRLEHYNNVLNQTELEDLTECVVASMLEDGLIKDSKLIEELVDYLRGDYLIIGDLLLEDYEFAIQDSKNKGFSLIPRFFEDVINSGGKIVK